MDKIDLKRVVRYIIVILFSSIIFIAAIFNLDKIAAMITAGVKILMPVILGLCLAFVINPLMSALETRIFARIQKKTKRKKNSSYRGLAILFSYFFVIGIVLSVFLIVIPQIRNAFVTLSHSLPDMIENACDWIRNAAADMGVSVHEIPAESIDWKEMFSTLSEKIGMNSVNKVFSGALFFVSSFFGGVFDLIMGIAISIHVLINKERIARFFKRLVLAYANQTLSSHVFEVTGIINEAFRNFISGQLTEAVILGVLCFIGMTIFRFPFALAVSAVVALTALIPVLGAWVGGILGAVLTLTVSPMKAIFFVLFIVILQQLENNLIYPRVVGKSMNLPAVLILVSVLLGGKVAGVIGMLLSVPLCSIIYTILKQSMGRHLELKQLQI
ncbi:AI-2E family transporter [Novisyntrophococcus fermenticellae]|uniref:AI-2E family transporter n=1 Tax=Novisyntrophococcus fermenticellae TaxID=2068655 RepID=UPI001E3A8D99|nr:AI-2E family transporter [Novisyntrophococcus fermenticellae]